jgi:hypothetical protein
MLEMAGLFDRRDIGMAAPSIFVQISLCLQGLECPHFIFQIHNNSMGRQTSQQKPMPGSAMAVCR